MGQQRGPGQQGQGGLAQGALSPRGATSPPAGHEEGVQCLQALCLTEFALLQTETAFIALFFLIAKVIQSFVNNSNRAGGHADEMPSPPAPAAGRPGTRPCGAVSRKWAPTLCCSVTCSFAAQSCDGGIFPSEKTSAPALR